jgi:hypothetical protein
VVKVRVLGYCNRVGVAGFDLALGWWVWLEWVRGALSNGGIFKRIGAVLSFRFLNYYVYFLNYISSFTDKSSFNNVRDLSGEDYRD